MIPECFRAYCTDVAERMQVPLDFPFAAHVVSLSAAMGRRIQVQPKANDPSYLIVPNLWGGMVGPSGAKKSPVLYLITEPLRYFEAEWQRTYEIEMKAYEAAKERRKNGEADGEPPEKPKRRRLLENDASYEKVQVDMSENPAGIFLLRDELARWLGMLDRAERAGERAFFLTAWDGKYSYNVGRIGRGGDGIYVPHACISLLGTLTPDRLKSYLVNREDHRLRAELNDGLMQRLQVLVWPDLAGEYQHIDRYAQSERVTEVQQIFEHILELDPETPTLFRFDTEAQQLFRDFDVELQKKVRNLDMHDELRSHLAKFDKLMAALAVSYEVAGRILDEEGISPKEPRLISAATTRQAIAACPYFESHARRVYSCVRSPELAAAWELAQKIRGKKLPAAFEPLMSIARVGRGSTR
jgi:putative DNA primase/helicase